MKTTLNKIRKYEPCSEGWQKLLTCLGKTKADDEPLALTTILDSNGLEDAIWCLRAVEGHAKEIRLYAVWCARQVQHLLTDQRSIDALAVAERYANGQATEDELAAAADAAWAAWEAAACEAARSAAGAAAYDGAYDVAKAASAAAWAAACEAARSAAGAAARAAARDAATWATVWSAAAESAREKQEAELRRICGEVE